MNVVSHSLLEAMNESSAEVGPEVDEFELAGLTPVPGSVVSAPWVAEAPAALECVLMKEVDLSPAENTLVIGEVKALHLSESLQMAPEGWAVEPASLLPVGRLGGEGYTLLGEVRKVPRPR
jgi:flavin reductase (DIM6/NTAB) family NADH-FMN oxidoreductase RutF